MAVRSFHRPWPLPFSGLLLGGMGVGNLLATYWAGLGNLFLLVFSLLWLGYTVQFVFHFGQYHQQLSTAPALASFATYPMASMQVAAFLSTTLLASLSPIIWWLAFALHLLLIILFTVRYVFGRRWDLLGPPWTVLYVGIAMATVTAGVVQLPALGRGVWSFALLAAIILFLALIRQLPSLVKQDTIPAPWAILAAPLSLLLLGSIRLDILSSNLILLVFSQLFYLFVLFLLIKILKVPFNPTFSSITFPVVVSALSLRASQIPQLSLLVYLETVIAFLIVAYVGWNYMKMLFRR